MDCLKFQESVLNCPICRNSGVRKETHFSKHYMKEFNKRMHKYVPVSPKSSHESFVKNRTITEKYTSTRDGYEQIHRNSLTASVKNKTKNKKSNHKMKKEYTNMPAIIYQVYTLATDSNKLKKKPSRTVYNYPYSSSSSESSTSFIGKKKKRSITMHPSAKKGSDDQDSDPEFSTCNKFPITEKHYRHIIDGIECPAHHKKPSFAKKKHKEEKPKLTKRADLNFNQTTLNQSKPSHSHACESKVKKKCICKSKCKHRNVEEERSDSILSEKTFTKFINSLHSYMNKNKNNCNYKYGRKILDSDSSCSLCQLEEKHIKKKKSSREKEHDANKHQHQHHHHHHNHNQQLSHYRPVTEDINK